MREHWYCIALILLLAMPFISAQNVDVTEGGNITKTNVNGTVRTLFWSGIVGWMNGTPLSNYSNLVSIQSTPNATVYLNLPNGTYADLENVTLVLTRLPCAIYPSQLYTPIPADFAEGGMFSNFTAFAGLNYNSTVEDPYDTFAPFPMAMCHVLNVSIACPYVTLNPNTRMGLLKFDNGTHVEPIFVGVIHNQLGYNGSNFDFEFMVPYKETYNFCIFRADMPPYVTIITPQPITYSVSTLELTYLMGDDIGINNCWYVLDGVKVNMPVCGPAYPFVVPVGTHTIALFANDTSGQITSANVTFSVAAKPSGPPGGVGGGGPSGTPVYPTVPPPPPPPPPPPSTSFTISADVFVVLDYPQDGVGEFYLSAGGDISNLSCQVSGDFGKYTSVEVPSSMNANETLKGRVIVSMPPVDTLRYAGGNVGILQCVAVYQGVGVDSNAAAVHLLIHRPRLAIENRTITLKEGDEINTSTLIQNIGEPNATAVNISVVIGYPFMMVLSDYPTTLRSGEAGFINFIVKSGGVQPGTYLVPIEAFEYGEQYGKAYAILSIKVLPRVKPVVAVCVFPDLTWTLLILLLGLLLAIILFWRNVAKEALSIDDRWERFQEKYRFSFGYAILIAAFFVIIWAIVVWLLARCV